MNTKNWKGQLSDFISKNPELESEVSKMEKIPTETKTIQKQTLLIELDKKGRKGKQATLISGFEGTEEELKNLATELKKSCGVGGSARGNEILIQGDCREKLSTLLTKMGYKTKRVN